MASRAQCEEMKRLRRVLKSDLIAWQREMLYIGLMWLRELESKRLKVFVIDHSCTITCELCLTIFAFIQIFLSQSSTAKFRPSTHICLVGGQNLIQRSVGTTEVSFGFTLCFKSNLFFEVCTLGGVKSECKEPQCCTKPCPFCKLDVASSFLDFNIHVLQVVQNCISDTPQYTTQIYYSCRIQN